MTVASQFTLRGIALYAGLLASVVTGGCRADRAPERVYDIGDIQPGMTDRDVAKRLGPPTETSVTRSFARDSVLWSLVDSDPVPRRTWSHQMSDAELSQTVADGDTSVTRTDWWEIWGADSLGTPVHVWVVDYERKDEQWRVAVTTDRSDGLAF